MKNKVLLIMMIVVVSISLLYLSCMQRPSSEKVVAKVNDYYMTVDDVKDKIKHSPYSSEMAKNLEEFLDVAIREQVLIQEAQRLGLDREKTFMRTIERYWAQTLIKELLDKQSRKIFDNISPDKRDRAMQAWIDELCKKADIKIYKNVLNEIAQGK